MPFDGDVAVALDTVLQRALGLSPEPTAAVPLAHAYATLRPEARARLLHVSCRLPSQATICIVSRLADRTAASGWRCTRSTLKLQCVYPRLYVCVLCFPILSDHMARPRCELD